MKTFTFFIACLITGMGIVSAQNKGPVIAISSGAIMLHPQVTRAQYEDFFINKYLPEAEKYFPGIKGYVLYGDRGENKYQSGSLYVFESVDVRNKYFPVEDGTENSEATRAALDKMNNLEQELNSKYVLGRNTKYTDWICLTPGEFKISRGSVVAVNTGTFSLKPEVTMDQFLDFFMNRYIPEFEKNAPGIKIYVIQGDRGEKKQHIGSIVVFNSVDTRDKYYPSEDSNEPSEITRLLNDKMEPLDKEYANYVAGFKRIFTDWIVK